jgi:hypothetical protein
MVEVQRSHVHRSIRMDLPTTIKEKIIEMLRRLPDNIDYDRAIEGIYVLQKVELAREQVRRGEVYDDDEVMDELLGSNETQAEVGTRGQS